MPITEPKTNAAGWIGKADKGKASIGGVDMADRRKQLEQAIGAAKQQVVACERERFVYEVILMSLKKKRADLGRPNLVRPRSKRARQS
jgi:hypothetical protein